MARTLTRRTVVLDESLLVSRRPSQVRAVVIERPVRVPLALGDLVERLAHPVARGIDRVTSVMPTRYRTHVAGCSACSRRRRVLNAAVPEVRTWAGWRGCWGRVRESLKS